MRLAWFSPFPPVRTGIADVSAELVVALRQRGFAIDAYPAAAAHDFPWRHRQRPYDLIVYQFGNSSHHDYAWAYALRYPGLVVLHDTQLHHARAAFLLRERRADDYRAEFAWNHPDVSADAAELAVHGLDSRLFYDWGMTRGLLATARLVAVHGEPARQALLDALSGEPKTSAAGELAAKVIAIRLGHGQPVTPDEREAARRRVRAAYGIAADALVFGVFGGLTPEKRIPQILAAMRATVAHAPSARLLLAGAAAAHYDVAAAVAAHGLEDRVTITGYLPDEELTGHLAACDISLNLRWPTARETSGPWLRALAAGLPTIVTDLAHTTDVPSLDPRTWQPRDVGNGRQEAADARSRGSSVQPVTVAVDILDEDHSLRLAMRRLAGDPVLRDRLGAAARAWWGREHSLEAMTADYLRAMADAAARPDPSVALPAHMRSDGDRQLRSLLAPFGLEAPI